MYPLFTTKMAYGTKTDAGDVTLVAAPGAGHRLVILDYRRARNAASDTTWITKEGDTVVDSNTLNSETPGFHDSFEPMTAWRLPANTALVGNNSGAVSVTWRVRYTVEAI